MSFEVPAESYSRFMGRFSEPLARLFCETACPGLSAGQRVLDVGCGPGELTTELVARVGEEQVSAIDPSPPFVEATRSRFPRAEVRTGRAEQLPYDDGSFDAALAQLVVHFMADPVAGVREMGRVTRSGAPVAACVWDHGGGSGPLSLFWETAVRLDPSVRGEAHLPGSADGDLVSIFERAGLESVRGQRLVVTVGFADFEDWWEPFTLGVGPAGDHVRRLDGAQLDSLVDALRQQLPGDDFELEVAAWCAIGAAPARG